MLSGNVAGKPGSQAAAKPGARKPEPAPGASPAAAETLLIDNRYRIATARSLGRLGGLDMFEAQDSRSIAGNIVALRADRSTPLHARLPEFITHRHDTLLAPLAHGSAGTDYWVICQAPPAECFAALKAPWSGNALPLHVLRSASAALAHLQQIGLTHRAIRPDNLFLAEDGGGVLFGPAWTSAPAARQPCMFEPPYVAICAAEARGEGSIADDVYALGVTLLALWAGEIPQAGCQARDIVATKLELGSYAALVNSLRLPRSLDDLLRAMLCDDPAGRPHPGALAAIDMAHPRRGLVRAPLRTSQPMKLDEHCAWNRRSLAVLCADQPSLALPAFRSGKIELWVRRYAEDSALAVRLEDLRLSEMPAGKNDAKAARGGAPGGQDDLVLMRLIAVLDPLAPMFYGRTWLWPDGLGPLLATSIIASPADAGFVDAARAAALLDAILLRGIAKIWQSLRPAQPVAPVPAVPPALLARVPRDEPRSLIFRVAYWLNPQLGCITRIARFEPAVSLAGFLAALERASAAGLLRPEAPKSGRVSPALIDATMQAFIAARLARAPAGPIDPDAEEPDERCRDLAQLATAQESSGTGRLPALASVLLPGVEPMLQDWPGRRCREERLSRLRHAAGIGDLVSMFACSHDPDQFEHDLQSRTQAERRVVELQSYLADRAVNLPVRRDANRRVARDTASATALCGVMATLLYELLL